MQMTNISNKVIGLGNVTVLPGETKEVPSSFETNPILDDYVSVGLVTLSGIPDAKADDTAVKDAEAVSTEDDEALKKAKLEKVKTASDEEIASMAKELGINPAECRNLVDVRRKVKAALSK